MGIDALRRITDLFDEGKELVLREDPPVLVWVNKLNSFETDEARQDGAVARARLILALKEIGTPEKALYEASLAEMNPDVIRDALLNAKQGEWFLSTANELRVDEQWREKVAMIERQNDQADEMSSSEKELLVKINGDYLEELYARIGVRRSEASKDLLGLDEGSLKERHREAWLDNQGMASFTRAYQKTQVYFALRLCSAAVKNEHGAFDHSACDHGQRACDTREEVTRIPQPLIDQVLSSLVTQSMPPSDSRFSAGAASSSASSQRPSAVGESTASTQEATSDEPPTS